MLFLRRTRFLWHPCLYQATTRGLLTTTMQLQTKNDNRQYSKGDVWVEAKPRVCLHDVHTEIRAGGLQPNSPVTLTAELVDENGKLFCSNAYYVSDTSGQVDVTSHESIGGSYTGIFPAGLLTTLKPAPNEFQYLRLMKRMPHIPWKINLSLKEGHEAIQEDSKTLATICLERHLMAEGVQRIPVREGRIRGTLFLPAGDGPHPGVLDMFGAIGGLQEFRSALLASRGIASLALAYFAYEDLPKTTDHFDLEYFEEAINFLTDQEKVVKDRCGVISVSKSADIATALGTWISKVKAVVTINGSPIVLDSSLSYRGRTLLEGVKLQAEHMKADEEGRLIPKRELFQENFTPDHPQFIPLNEADEGTHFLAVAGGDDTWSTDIAILNIKRRMDFYRKTNYETKLYPGAGHLIEPPYGPLIYQSYHRYLPVTNNESAEKIMGVRLLWGGNAKDMCSAQEDLWIRMRTFILKHVRDESLWYQNLSRIGSKL